MKFLHPRNEKDIIEAFFGACSILRSLSVVGKSGEWTSAFGERLEKLQLVSGIIPNY